MTLDPTTTPSDPPSPGRRAFLARAAVATGLLAASAVLRVVQIRRVDASMLAGLAPPFPLDALPMNLGDFQGSPTEMDPRIVRGTGCTDLITRRYVNQKTGVTMEVIVLYGPPLLMFGHTPEACYPAAGFKPNGDTIGRQVTTPTGPAAFRSVAYVKGDGPSTDSQEIYYSWRIGGRWNPSIGGPRDLSRIPGMFKVQVSRRLQRDELRTVNNPCESFLQALVPEIEARIDGRTGAAPRA